MHGYGIWVILKFGNWNFYGFKLETSLAHSKHMESVYPWSSDELASDTSKGLKFEIVRSLPVYVDEQSWVNIWHELSWHWLGFVLTTISFSIDNKWVGSLNWMVFELIPVGLRVSLQKLVGTHSSLTTKGSVVKHQIVSIDKSGFLHKLLLAKSNPLFGWF